MSDSTPLKTILVTGGNNGIGLAICTLLASLPSHHVLLASRSATKGNAAIASIKPHQTSTVSLVELDITDPESLKSALSSVSSTHTHLDCLINNAGICPVEFTRQTMTEALNTNAISPALVTRAFAPLLLKAKDPRVVYVSSVLGSVTQRCDPKDVAYEADFKSYRVSKAALDMVVACDAWEYKGRMKVWAYCPGYVVTDLAGMREMKEKEGVAGSAEESAKGVLSILEGKRDADVGKFVHGEDAEKGGVYPW